MAIDKMKQGKSGGPTGVVSEMLKVAGETGTMWMIDLCNAVVRDGKIPEDWSKSWMVMVDLHYTDFSYSKSYKSYNKSYSFFRSFGWGDF